VPNQLRSPGDLLIQNPCSADWDSMSGNDRIRFCEHCSLNVTDLSRLTRFEATRLVARAQGRLCVRFVSTASGEILHGAPSKLYHLGRRVSRIAATAFTATLSLSSAAAQNTSRSIEPIGTAPTISRPDSQALTGATLSGLISDPNGAVVQGATVSLVNAQTHVAFVTNTNEEGVYRFARLDPGKYQLTAEAVGFARQAKPEIDLNADSSLTMDLTLQIPEIVAEVEVKSGEVTEVFVTSGAISIAEPVESLVKAASKEDLIEVAKLLQSGADANVVDRLTDLSALAAAAQNGNRDLINILLSAGANPNLTNKRGETPLMYLGDNTTTDMIQQFLAAGVDINARDKTGGTALINLALNGSFDVTKQLIDAGARIEVEDDEGNTVLMSAAHNKDAQLLRYLIKAGAKVDVRNHDGESAFTIAARSGRAETLKVLIDAGASLNLERKSLDVALILAMSNEDTNIVQVLLDAGASPNAKNDHGETVFMTAVKAGHPEVVKRLLDAGAELNAIDDDGWTPLMYADELEVVRVLVNAGADLTIKNKDGQTALAMARRYEQTDVAKFLESKGAPD
jgi:uncharacterized protein